MNEWDVDGSPAEHESDGVDELQLRAGDDRGDHEEHGHDQHNHRDDDGYLLKVMCFLEIIKFKNSQQKNYFNYVNSILKG
jgi:hypothetical protein